MRYYVSVALTIIAVLFVSSLAMAQQYGHGFGGGMMGSYSGLSAEKQASLNTLRDGHHKKITPLVLEFRAKQAALDSLLVAEKVDKNKVSAVNKQINDLYGKILTEKNDFRRQVFELTGYLMSGSGMGMGGMKGSGSGMKGMGGKCGGSKSMMNMMMPSNTQTQ
jgi:hypothetical protein